MWIWTLSTLQTRNKRFDSLRCFICYAFNLCFFWFCTQDSWLFIPDVSEYDPDDPAVYYFIIGGNNARAAYQQYFRDYPSRAELSRYKDSYVFAGLTRAQGQMVCCYQYCFVWICCLNLCLFVFKLGRESNEVRAIGVTLSPLSRMALYRALDKELLKIHADVDEIEDEFDQAPAQGQTAIRSYNWKKWVLCEAGENDLDVNSRNVWLNFACTATDAMWEKFKQVKFYCYFVHQLLTFCFVYLFCQGSRQIWSEADCEDNSWAWGVPSQTAEHRQGEGERPFQGRTKTQDA